MELNLLRPEKVLPALFERIAVEHPSPSRFSIGDTEDWPDGVLLALVDARLLTPAPRSNEVYCGGCDWRCHKPVVVRRPAGGDAPVAFIVCDEAPDYGRVPVAMQDLASYQTSLAAVADFVANALAIGPVRRSASGAAYLLGRLKGRRGMRPVQIEHGGNQLMVCVGQYREPLSQTLMWSAAGPAVDIVLLRRLADRKDAAASGTRPNVSDRGQQFAKTRATRVRDAAILRQAKDMRRGAKRAWSTIADKIAKLPVATGLSSNRVRRIIADGLKLEREKSRSKHQSRI